MADPMELANLKETLQKINQLYQIRLKSAKSVEDILLRRIVSRPISDQNNNETSLKKHKEYEKIVRATLRQDSNQLRSVCMGIQLRAQSIKEQIQKLESQHTD